MYPHSLDTMLSSWREGISESDPKSVQKLYLSGIKFLADIKWVFAVKIIGSRILIDSSG